MPSQEQIDAEYENAELRRRVDQLEATVNALKEAGLDRLIESGLVQFDNVPIRWDSHGMQVETAGTAVVAIYFKNTLVPNPDIAVTNLGALLSGTQTADGSDASLSAISDYANDHRADLNVFADESDGSSRSEVKASWGSVSAELEVGAAATGSYVQLSGAAILNSVLSPAQITANQDNYNPSGLTSVSVLRLSTDAARDITGIVPAFSNQILILLNVGSFNIVLKNDVTSTAANRFLFPADITLAPNEGVTLLYDSTSSRWRCFGRY